MTQSLDLAGSVAVVTGASRGIGKGCALELGTRGATVYVTGRSVDEADHPLPGTVHATAAEITTKFRRVLTANLLERRRLVYGRPRVSGNPKLAIIRPVKR